LAIADYAIQKLFYRRRIREIVPVESDTFSTGHIHGVRVLFKEGKNTEI